MGNHASLCADPGTKWDTDLQVGNVDYGIMRFVERVVDIYMLGEEVRLMLERCADPLATDEPYEALEIKTLSISGTPVTSVPKGGAPPAARPAASKTRRSTGLEAIPISCWGCRNLRALVRRIRRVGRPSLTLWR